MPTKYSAPVAGLYPPTTASKRLAESAALTTTTEFPIMYARPEPTVMFTKVPVGSIVTIEGVCVL